MTTQSESEGLRRRLVDVLKERLSELQDDEVRRTNLQTNNRDPLIGPQCGQCGEESFRFLEGKCIRCWRADSAAAVADMEAVALARAGAAAAEKERYEFDGTMTLKNARRALGIVTTKRQKQR
jgi:hypothetical protein